MKKSSSKIRYYNFIKKHIKNIIITENLKRSYLFAKNILYSFLSKGLIIDWKRYKKYQIANNNGNDKMISLIP